VSDSAESDHSIAKGREEAERQRSGDGYRQMVRDRCRRHPCIFNAAVDVYERIQRLELKLRSEAYDAFHEAYEEETLCGRRHHVMAKSLLWLGRCRRGPRAALPPAARAAKLELR